MKIKSFFLFFIILFSCTNIYCETIPEDINHPPTVLPVNPPHQSDALNKEQPVKAPKNYFDIKADEKEGDRFMTEFMNMLSTLGIIVVIILIATWFLKKLVNTRIEQMNTTSLIKVIERRTLTPKTSVFLLDIQGSGVILGESMNGIVNLGSFDVNEVEKKAFKDFSDKNSQRQEK